MEAASNGGVEELNKLQREAQETLRTEMAAIQVRPSPPYRPCFSSLPPTARSTTGIHARLVVPIRGSCAFPMVMVMTVMMRLRLRACPQSEHESARAGWESERAQYHAAQAQTREAHEQALSLEAARHSDELLVARAEAEAAQAAAASAAAETVSGAEAAEAAADALRKLTVTELEAQRQQLEQVAFAPRFCTAARSLSF